MHPLLARTLVRQPFRALLAPLVAGRATILMFHRFHDPVRSPWGHSPELLRQNLSWLHGEGFRFGSLGEVAEQLATGQPVPPRTVVFTVDDGYRDFADIAAPVFAEFDCPVTVFLVTGFLDGREWLWWDQVAWALWTSALRTVGLTTSERRLEVRWEGRKDMESARGPLVEALKWLPDAERRAAINRLAADLEVTLPAAPPEWAEPMTWDQARALGEQGVSFGPHTVSHPILSRLGPEELRAEVRVSWERVRTECPTAVPVFCYPNGDAGSFGEREIVALRDAGLRGAVTSVPGHAAPAAAGSDGAWRLSRLPYDDIPGWLPQLVSGFEMLKSDLRRRYPRSDRVAE